METHDRAQHIGVWNSRMSSLAAEYQRHFENLDGDVPGRLAAQAYLENSTAVYHGSVIGMGFLPKLYDKAALSFFEDVVHTTYGILDVMTRHFIEDAQYRALFRFSPLLEQLILLPSEHGSTIPIARIDIFLNEQDGSFKFCEFNTDGTSAMSEDEGVSNALANTPLLRSFAGRHRVEAQLLKRGNSLLMRLPRRFAPRKDKGRTRLSEYKADCHASLAKMAFISKPLLQFAGYFIKLIKAVIM